jgi:hypothetical protein
MANLVRQRSGRNARHQPISISIAIAVLAAAVLVCTALVAVPLWTALVRDWQVQPLADECRMLKEGPVRQTCYESRRHGSPRHPARGATAPLRSPD